MIQEETIDFCKEYNIFIEVWCPFSNGQIFNNFNLMEIVKKYSKSIAQLTLH